MGLFNRTATPEPQQDDHVWSLDRIIEEKREDAADANPAIAARIHPDLPTTTEAMAVREAGKPVDTVKVGCGMCAAEVPRSEWADHRCNLSPRQVARNRRAMKQMARAAAFPTIVSTCDMCGTEWSGGVHRCTGKKELTPADAAALAWQQAGARQALQEMINTANGTDGVQAS